MFGWLVHSLGSLRVGRVGLENIFGTKEHLAFVPIIIMTVRVAKKKKRGDRMWVGLGSWTMPF